MKFCDQLNLYIEILGITRKELASASGLSAASISRYCSGEREPGFDSRHLEGLAEGISSIALAKGMEALTREEVTKTLSTSVNGGINVDYDVFIANLNSLMKQLEIRTSELARGIYSDSSYVSRILSGARRPGNIVGFINDVATFVTHRFSGGRDAGGLGQLTDADAETLSSPALLREHLVLWLGSSPAAGSDDSIPHFLTRMDDFDLGDYMESIRYDEIKLPPSIPQMPTRREYTGIERMMESELDFMKTTVLSRSTDSCILYSDMPLSEMAADPEFPKKYLFGLAMMLKKGLRLNFIHDINRPFSEMMIGLENYIPMYMTGLISPYYLPASQSGVFTHLLKVSGAAALEGTAIAGDQAGGKYMLYRSKEDVAHYRKRADALLSKALPLMDIFREDRRQGFQMVLGKMTDVPELRLICSSLPVYFLEPDTFEAALASRRLTKADEISLRQYRDRMRSGLETLLKNGRVILRVPSLSREDFERAPMGLSFVDLFISADGSIPYETYLEYMDELRSLAEREPNLILESDPMPAYRNINITIAGERMVIVSKEKSPAIHFVIYHKRMIRAFQSFEPSVSDSR